MLYTKEASEINQYAKLNSQKDNKNLGEILMRKRKSLRVWYSPRSTYPIQTNPFNQQYINHLLSRFCYQSDDILGTE